MMPRVCAPSYSECGDGSLQSRTSALAWTLEFLPFLKHEVGEREGKKEEDKREKKS